MAIASINPSSTAAQLQTKQSGKSETAVAADDAAKAGQAKAQQSEKAQQAQRQSQPQKPAPVVNTQGQTTGRVVNTTA